ncbi:MAG: cation:proton antiporter [Gemmatimonadota bacterium]
MIGQGGGADVRAKGVVNRLLALAVLIALQYVWRDVPKSLTPGGELSANLGFLLLTAYVGGTVAKRLGASRVTGYILVGLLVGPGGLALLNESGARDLGFLNDVAIVLIAMTAGGELGLKRLRSQGRYIASITLTELTVVFTLVFVTIVTISNWLPVTAGRELGVVLTMAMVFGSIAVANSPSVAIAVITDTRSRGPVTSTILSVTVIKDVVVIVLFGVALSMAQAILSPDQGLELDFALTLAWEIGGSLVVGGLLGTAIAAYLSWVNQHLVLLTLVVAWLAVELAGLLHLEVLLLGLAAGFTLENLLPVEGGDLVRALEQSSMPLYALFFSLAGASVHLEALVSLLFWVLLLVSVRAASIYVGTRLGARIGNAPDSVRRYAWTGFVPQAGVTIGMATIMARTFPEWGDELQSLFVAMVAVHELIGPILLNWGLSRAGEVGAADAEEVGAGSAAPDDALPASAGA